MSDPVYTRRYFSEGARQWLKEARIDKVYELGLHAFLGGVRDDIAALNDAIGRQFLLD